MAFTSTASSFTSTASWVVLKAASKNCGRKPDNSHLGRGVLRLFGGSAFWSSPLALAGFFQQLDISHGSPRDERTLGVFFFDGFYSDSTGVIADQSSVEATPSGEPHGYSLSIPLLRQVPGQHASLVCLHSPSILPLPGLVPPVLGPSSAVKRRQARHKREGEGAKGGCGNNSLPAMGVGHSHHAGFALYHVGFFLYLNAAGATRLGRMTETVRRIKPATRSQNGGRDSATHRGLTLPQIIFREAALQKHEEGTWPGAAHAPTKGPS